MIDWPSTTDEGGNAPPLATVLAGDGPETIQAGYLAAAIAELQKQDWETKALQIGVRSEHHGAFTVPAIIATGETPAVVFTHFGAWDDDAYKRFIRWLECVRTSWLQRGCGGVGGFVKGGERAVLAPGLVECMRSDDERFDQQRSVWKQKERY